MLHANYLHSSPRPGSAPKSSRLLGADREIAERVRDELQAAVRGCLHHLLVSARHFLGVHPHLVPVCDVRIEEQRPECVAGAFEETHDCERHCEALHSTGPPHHQTEVPKT